MILSRNPEICAAELDGEVCLFNPENAEYLNLNSTGSAIWTALDHPTDIEDLINRLLSVYTVAPEICRAETESFIVEAIQRGIILKL